MDKDNKNTRYETPKWEEELEFLKSVLNKTPLQETVKWGVPVFTYDGKNVVAIGGFKSYFGIWFYKGVFLKDDADVLINANEENTKSLRQWRFTSINDVDEKLVIQYINEAVEIEKAGLQLKPVKKETILPEILQKELDNIPELKTSFEALTPFKQREYCEHIASAKRDETKLNRLEKIKPMILKGIGLHDKYR